MSLAAIAVVLAGCGGSTATATSGSAATVNGVSIPRSAVSEIVAVSGVAGTKLSNAEALNEAVRQALVAAAARRLGVTVNDAEVTKRLDEVAAATGGQSTLDQMLSSAHVSVDALRHQLAQSLLADAVAAAKFPSVRSTPAQALAYYRQHRSQFTVPAQVKLGDIAVKAKRIAQNAIARMNHGEPFTVTARQFSFDPELKDASGQLGWVTLASLPAPLQKAVAKLRPGQLSGPVKSINGWHVLKLYARRPQVTRSFASIQPAIARELTREKRAVALAKWLVGARARAQVVTSP